MTRFITILTVSLFLLIPVSSEAVDPKAREIMQKVEDRDEGDNRTSRMVMVLTDKNGAIRKKYFINYMKDDGKDTKLIMFIEKPPNIRNTGFLTFDYDDPNKDDDQWLYLPAIGKAKRIASNDKDGSFMGSDLNYSDMTQRNLSDYTFKLLKEISLKGQDVWLIESIPVSEKVINETGYKKSILAIRKDNYIVTRIKAWTGDGGYVKIMDFDKIEQIDGIWIAQEIKIVKRQGKSVKHKTAMFINEVKFNQNLSDDLFTTRRLIKGL